jgi:hypothetical protein
MVRPGREALETRIGSLPELQPAYPSRQVRELLWICFATIETASCPKKYKD